MRQTASRRVSVYYNWLASTDDTPDDRIGRTGEDDTLIGG
jgi:hypothetical protein